MATLNDLKQNKTTGIVESPDSLKVLTKEDLRKIAPPKQEDSGKELLNDELSSIDNIINLEMEAINSKEEEFIDSNQEILDDAIFDAPLEDMETGLLTPEQGQEELSKAFKDAVTAVNEDESIKAASDAVANVGTADVNDSDMDDLLSELDDDDDDFDDEEDDSDISDEDDDDEDDEEKEKLEKEEQNQMIKEMQQQITEHIKPFENIIDLKSFTISTKPKRITKVLEESTTKPTATWVLLDSEKPFECSALGAVEIDNLEPSKLASQSGRISALKQMYGTLYSHYESPNKPKSLEEWVKTISFEDQDNLIFGYYKATFGLSNLITYACDKCKEVKVKNMPIESCIKYSDDETKEEVEKLLKFGDSTHVGVIKSKVVQVSDKYAVSIKNPSIYNIVFELGVLDSAFTNKFSDVLGVVGYIENFYEIDTVQGSLIPIEVKEDPKNITKSVKRRIRAKVQMLRNLTSDQYNILAKEITILNKNSSRISYCQPAYTCEKCGNEITENVMSAQELLFTRHQLGLIASLSVE